MNRPLYTASEIEHRTGVASTTLRQWERRYGLPKPTRNQSGYRLYSRNDLTRIEFMKRQIALGVPANRAAQLALELKLNSPTKKLPTKTTPKKFPELNEFVETLLNADFDNASKTIGNALHSQSVESVLMDLMQPALVEIGERWHKGLISTAHEHRASSFLRGKLHAFLELAGQSQFGEPVVVACPPGEWHEIGGLMLTVMLRRAGLKAHFLGANTPLEDIRSFVHEIEAKAVLLSVSCGAVALGLLEQKEKIAVLAPLVGFGGMAINQQPELAEQLGGVYLGENGSQVLAQLQNSLMGKSA